MIVINVFVCVYVCQPISLKLGVVKSEGSMNYWWWSVTG